jgi:hypothetical protein
MRRGTGHLHSLLQLGRVTILQENFYPFYVFTAVRRFMFFLDRRRTGQQATASLAQPVSHLSVT